MTFDYIIKDHEKIVIVHCQCATARRVASGHSSSMDFDAAVLKSKEIKSASNDDKLALYKLFKQVGFAKAHLRG